MPNLIDQMNILKNLPDQALQQELAQPSGAVPSYLVLSEANRRQNMRQRYAGQVAMQRPQTTVMQDQLSRLAPPTSMGAAAGPGAPMMAPGGVGSPSMPPSGAPMPAGIAAAGAPGYAMGGIVGYADGGYVDPDYSTPSPVYDDGGISLPPDYLNAPLTLPTPASAIPVPLPSYAAGTDQAAINRAQLQALGMYGGDNGSATALADTGTAPMDIGATGNLPATSALGPASPNYSGIAAGYQKELDRADKARAQDPWLALMQAGLSIAGGTSPYALSNIGAGGAEGLKTYAALEKDDNTSTDQALQGLSATDAQQRAEQMQQLNFQMEQQKLKDAEDPNSVQNQPTIVKDMNYVDSLPDGSPEKDQAMALIQPAAAQTLNMKKDIAHQVAEGVFAGNVAPDLQGQYSIKPLVESDLLTNHPGTNLAQLQQQWQAAQRNTAAMNGPQQLRLRQTIGELAGQDGQPGMLDKLQSVADDWNGSGLPVLNGANLIAAKNGAYGETGIEKATQFQAELADVSPALAGVFSSGNSPTDKSLANAQSIFLADTSKDAFNKLITLARTNLNYRRMALDQAPAGSPNNRYNYAGSTPTTVPGTPGATGPVDYGNGVTIEQVSP